MKWEKSNNNCHYTRSHGHPKQQLFLGCASPAGVFKQPYLHAQILFALNIGSSGEFTLTRPLPSMPLPHFRHGGQTISQHLMLSEDLNRQNNLTPFLDTPFSTPAVLPRILPSHLTFLCFVPALTRPIFQLLSFLGRFHQSDLLV